MKEPLFDELLEAQILVQQLSVGLIRIPPGVPSLIDSQPET
jgi:hypothetical protein